MKKVFALILLAIFVYSCGDNGNNPTDSSVLMPLKIGNYWEYYSNYFYTSSTDSAAYRLTVDSEIEYNGENQMQLRYFNIFTNATFLTPSYYKNEPNGLRITSRYLGMDYIMVFKYPVSKGEIISEDENTKFYVDSINVVYTTLAGKFNCIKYVQVILDDSKETDISYNYYTPGIGQIANEDYEINPITGNKTLVMKSVLTKYKIK